MSDDEKIIRRDVKARGTSWARGIAAALARAGVRPNTISLTSIFFAACSGACLVLAGHATPNRIIGLLVLAAVLIQLRLLCNLFDGMVAVEGGLKTKSGEIYNDLPDRIADPLIFVCSGYAIPHIPFHIEIGWLAGLLAVLTAYVRVLGGAAGATQRFAGPMAKQHRLAVITVALIAAAIAEKWQQHEKIIAAALVIIAAGSAITVLRRASMAVRELESK